MRASSTSGARYHTTQVHIDSTSPTFEYILKALDGKTTPLVNQSQMYVLFRCHNARFHTMWITFTSKLLGRKKLVVNFFLNTFGIQFFYLCKIVLLLFLMESRIFCGLFICWIILFCKNDYGNVSSGISWEFWNGSKTVLLYHVKNIK